MILELFAVLLGLSLVGIWLGYYTDDNYYTFVGLFFLFLLGIVLLSGNVEYRTGATIIETNSTSTQVTYQYGNFTGDNAHWFGYILTVLGGLGMAAAFLQIRRQKGEAW